MTGAKHSPLRFEGAVFVVDVALQNVAYNQGLAPLPL